MLPVDGVAGEELLRLTASVEQHSEHPIAAGVVRTAGKRGLTVPRVL